MWGASVLSGYQGWISCNAARGSISIIAISHCVVKQVADEAIAINEMEAKRNNNSLIAAVMVDQEERGDDVPRQGLAKEIFIQVEKNVRRDCCGVERKAYAGDA